MLNDVDKINWGKLGVAKVPDLLRGMADENIDTVHKAHMAFREYVTLFDIGIDEYGHFNDIKKHLHLFENRIHLKVLPFIIDLLNTNEVKQKHQILFHLHTMCLYADYFTVEKNTSHLIVANEIREAVWSHHEGYLTFLESDDENTLWNAVQLLLEFDERYKAILSHLDETLLRIQTSDMCAKILWLIYGEIFDGKQRRATEIPTFVNRLYSMYNANDQHTVRITIVITLISILKDEVSPQIIRYLQDSLISQPFVRQPYNILSTSSRLQAMALIQLGTYKGLPAVINILRHSEIFDHKLHTLVAGLMLAFVPDYRLAKHTIYPTNTVYPAGKHPTSYHVVLYRPNQTDIDVSIPTVLNASQETLIEYLVEADWIWDVHSNIFNAFNLPNQRDALKQLL